MLGARSMPPIRRWSASPTSACVVDGFFCARRVNTGEPGSSTKPPRTRELLEDVLNTTRPPPGWLSILLPAVHGSDGVGPETPARAVSTSAAQTTPSTHYEVINLARHRGLQAVGNVPRHFLVEAYRSAARSMYKSSSCAPEFASEVFAPPTISTSGIKCGG